MQEITQTLKSKFDLADNFENCSGNFIECGGILGTDAIQNLDLVTVSCMNGKALQLENKILPLGNSDHFLNGEQLLKNMGLSNSNLNQTIATKALILL